MHLEAAAYALIW